MEADKHEIFKQLAETAILNLKITHSERSRGKIFPNTAYKSRVTEEAILEEVVALCGVEYRANRFEVMEILRDDVAKLPDIKKIGKAQRVNISGTFVNWMELIPAVDLRDDQKKIFDANMEVVDISYDAWVKNTSKEMREEIAPIFANFTYDPYDTRKWKDVKKSWGVIREINDYTAPAWRLEFADPSEEDLKELTCPPIIDDFLQHLFPEKENKEFVINWLYHAFHNRCDTYLVLNGDKGVGKNTLWKLIKSFIGPENSKEPPVSSLESGFNAFLHKNRMLFFDELRADSRKSIDRLKKYANEDQNIEFKGVDADKTFKTFNSCIISNNDLTSLFLGWDERRFSVPILTRIKMIDAYTNEQLQEINERFEKDAELHWAFGHWILKQGKYEKRWNAHSVFKSPRFWEIVHANLSLWEQFVVEKITSKEFSILDLNELRKEYKMLHGEHASKMPIDVTKFKKLINNYRHLGQHKLGTIEGKGKEIVILVSDDFRASANPETIGGESTTKILEMLDI